MARVITENWKVAADKAIKAVLFTIIPIILPLIIFWVKGEVNEWWFVISGVIYVVENFVYKAIQPWQKEAKEFEWFLKPLKEAVVKAIPLIIAAIKKAIKKS